MARKILLADDSVTAQNMGRKILADAGYEVITVNNGSAALKKIPEVKPDLIVLDVYMPGYSGLEVCQRLKEAPDTSRIPVLLTVGKLEPFKPEEARRARAEGFIVKPFEASELLSALTKLEDKMVPRSESSKPGRFARTIAAVEEGRYDKTVASDEDSGWKNRISFPKKSKPAEQEQSEDSAIYNPVNKDLRTVVDNKPASAPQEAKGHDAKVHEVQAREAQPREAQAEESRVDLTALAPEGLPKDVTPEEIAALAAAAAQMQGKIANVKTDDAKVSEAKTDDAKNDAKIVESKFAEPVAEAVSATAKIESLDSAKVDAAKIEDKTEAKLEAVVEAKPVVVESATIASTPEQPAATFADQALEQKKLEPSAEPPTVEAASVASIASSTGAAPTGADVSAAIDAMETLASAKTPSRTSNDEGSDHDRHAEPEPVTMAMAAAASAQGTSAPRWTAVAIALAPEESGIVLEDEMRKAFAAYAGADSGTTHVSASTTHVAASIPERLPVEPVTPVRVSAPVEAVQQITVPAPTEPEVASSAIAAISSATEEIGARVKSFETVAALSTEVPAAMPAEAPSEQLSEASIPKNDVPEAIETKEEVTARSDESQAGQIAAAEQSVAEVISPMPGEQPKSEEPATAQEEIDREAPTVPAAAQAVAEETSAISAQASKEISEDKEAAPANEVVEASMQADSPTSSEASRETSHEAVSHDPSRKESDIAATTAAAWASWRRIRESGDSKDARSRRDQDQTSDSSDEAAMAVAAGAEKTPEEGPEIASIVDSVLADLRPKIVEEISKKLKKK